MLVCCGACVARLAYWAMCRHKRRARVRACSLAFLVRRLLLAVPRSCRPFRRAHALSCAVLATRVVWLRRPSCWCGALLLLRSRRVSRVCGRMSVSSLSSSSAASAAPRSLSATSSAVHGPCRSRPPTSHTAPWPQCRRVVDCSLGAPCVGGCGVIFRRVAAFASIRPSIHPSIHRPSTRRATSSHIRDVEHCSIRLSLARPPAPHSHLVRAAVSRWPAVAVWRVPVVRCLSRCRMPSDPHLIINALFHAVLSGYQPQRPGGTAPFRASTNQATLRLLLPSIRPFRVPVVA